MPLASPPASSSAVKATMMSRRGRQPGSLQPDQGFEDRRVLALHVDRTAAIEPAAGLGQLEGIVGPVLAPGLHDVEVADVEDRLALPAPAEANDDIALGRVVWRDHNGDVGGRETGGEEPGGDLLRQDGRAVGVGAVGLDQLLQDLASEGLILRRRHGERRLG
jgi:hypothetical protein